MPAAGGAQVAHVAIDEEDLGTCLSVDLPPESFYVTWREWMKKRWPSLDGVFLDLLEDQEVFLDLCAVSGFSLGAKKSACRSPSPTAAGNFGRHFGRKTAENFPDQPPTGVVNETIQNNFK